MILSPIIGFKSKSLKNFCKQTVRNKSGIHVVDYWIGNRIFKNLLTEMGFKRNVY